MKRSKPDSRSGPAAARSGEVWLFGNIRFDDAQFTLECGGKPVELERRSLELLRLLLAHAGEVVTKDELLTELWPDRVVTENSLTKCVARLRQALGADAAGAIQTVHGYGYQFVAPLRAAPRRQSADIGASFGYRPGDAVPQRPDWRLVQRLGTGGTADLWLGTHAETAERRVFKFARDGAQLTALKREITLSRLLDDQLGARDDFVHVLDWNLGTPPYFIERQWSPAGALPDWANDSGGLAQFALSIRLDLVAQIADALAAAHSVGVLHKDVKPANVLVHLDKTGAPRIRLADFGSGSAFDVARFGPSSTPPLDFTRNLGEDDSQRTTRLYAAPELLLGGPASVQADVYSLGVMLYQMIVGDFSRPFAPGWEAGIADDLLREDVAAAADGDPSRRLTDAAQLALRLRSLDARRQQRRHEADERDKAAEIRHTLERAQARRGPLAVLTSTLVVALLAITWLYFQAERAGQNAQASAATANAVTGFVTHDLLSSANPFLRADPGVTVLDLLPAATASLDYRFKNGGPERAAIEDAIGNAYAGLGDRAHAEPLLEAALAAQMTLKGSGDPDTQRIRLDLLEMYRLDEDHPAMRRTAEAILAAQGEDGGQDPKTALLARYAIAFADCQDHRTEAICVKPLQDLAGEIRRRLGPHDELFLDAESTAAFVLSMFGHIDQAVPMAREALSLAQDTYGPTNPMVDERKNRLAQVLWAAGRPDEAIKLAQEARDDLLAARGRETTESAKAANTLGLLFIDAKRYADALPLFEAARDFSSRAHGEEFIETRQCSNNLAVALAKLGRLDEAIALENRVVEIEKRQGGPDDVDLISYIAHAAGFYGMAGKPAMAETDYRDAITRLRALPIESQVFLGFVADRFAALLVDEHKIDEARAVLAANLATLQTALGPDNPRIKAAKAALDRLPPASN